jgi:Peptidase family C25/FlgD Ig-like domain
LIRSPYLALALATLGLSLARPALAERMAPPPVLESVQSTGYRVRVPFGEPEVVRADVLGHSLAEILLPEAVPSSPAPGAPPLPTRTVFLRVPWGVSAAVTSSPAAERSLGSMRPAPVAHLLTDPRARARLSPEGLERALRGGGPTALRSGGAAPLHAFTETAAGGERILAVTLRPVRWDPRSGEARMVDEITLDVRWDRSVEPVSARPRGRASLSPASAVGPSYPLRSVRAAAVAQRVDPSRPWVSLGVTRPGLYQIGAADLAAAGVPAGSIDPASIRIFRATPGDLPADVDVDLGPDSLRECAIEVTGAGDGSLDAPDRVFFYATGSTGFGHDLALGKGPEYEEAEHSDVETLWLTWGPGGGPAPPRRMAQRDAAPATPGAPVRSTVTHRIHFETNRVANFNLIRPPLRWERWFDRLLIQGARIPLLPQPPGAEPGTAADVRVRMWGLGASPGATVPDHVVRIYWNQALVDTAGWEQTEPQDLTATGLAVTSQDRLEIEVPILVDPGPFPARTDLSYFAWFEVGYQRRLAAANDTLQFAAPDSTVPGRIQYALTSIGDSAAAWLLDRTDPENPVRLVGGTWSGAAPAFALTVEDSVGGVERRRYTLVSTTRAPRPLSISRYAPVSSAHTANDLLNVGNGADYVIVTPPMFLAHAETLAVYRSAFLSGVASPRVRIVTTDRIFAQFGSGRPSPVAIRNFIQYAYRYWVDPAPTYVCLLGDASYDPKNYGGIPAPDLVPTFSDYYDPNGETQYVSDDFFGFLDGPADLLLDVVLGRLPAGNAAQAATLVSGKLRAYEANREFDVWRARAILAADDANVRNLPDGLGNQHVAQMERKDRIALPKPVERQKIYLNDYAFADTTRQSKPAAREEFITQVNRGGWITDYIGHGSEDVLADEQLFRSIDASRLVNAARPTILGTFSCTVGKFDEPGSEGLGERLLELPQGGSVVSLAATDDAFGNPSTALNDDFLKYQFPLAPRVDSLRTSGLAFALGKNENANSSEFSTRKYVFLGDPGVVPPLPRGRGVWEKAPLDSLVRGEVAVLRGHALAASDTLPDTLSTGLADILVQGPPIRRTQVAPINGAVVQYVVPGYTLFRGQVPLDRGAFEVRFVVPTDARIVGDGGRLRALLSEAGGEGVGLAVDSIRIATAAPTRVDSEPPAIRIRYPSASDSTLRPGDRITFEIADSSGIDLTRIDNAHSIFVIVDDRGTPYEITAQFAYEDGSYTRGMVEFVVPDLADGPHRLEVHASDTFRNIAVQNFIVDVARSASVGGALVLDQVFNYPNPFPRETYLHARINQPARLRIKILTVAGRRVREIDLDGKAGENYIPWDGRDSVGENVAIGVYLFHVTAESPSGGRVTAVGRALRTE